MSGLQIFGFITVFGTVAVAVVCFILYAILHRKRHYRCPNCGERFKTTAASTFLAARDGVDKRMVCPYCGHFGYMEDHRDEELEEKEENRAGNGNEASPLARHTEKGGPEGPS